MTAVAACLICGTEPLENARFCRGCGSPVGDADTRAGFGRWQLTRIQRTGCTRPEHSQR